MSEPEEVEAQEVKAEEVADGYTEWVKKNLKEGYTLQDYLDEK